MDNVILTDIEGNKYKAEILFTHFDYFFSKNYIVYLFDKDLQIGRASCRERV